MSKASVVIKVGDDVWKIAQNVWKAIKGSPHIKQVSSKTPAKTISKKSLENKIQLQRIKIGAKNRETGEALKKLGKESKVKLKSGPLDVKPKVVKPKVVKPKVVKSKPSPWAKSTTKKTPSEASSLAKADVARGPKITPTNAKSGNIVTRGGKRAGVVVTQGGKKFIKTKTGKLIAIGAAGAGGYYLGKAIDKSIAGTNGTATTSSGAATTPIKKPPKQPLGPPSVYPPTKKPPTTRVADDDLEAKAPKADPKVAAKLAKPKTLEQKLKSKWLEFRGGEPAFGKKGSDAAWKTHVLDMRRGSEVGLTYTDQQNYDKIIEERKELATASKGATKKKRGGVIKRNKGGPVRGVGKALRGYGNNSIYSNKMY